MRIWLRVIPKSAHAGVDGIVSDARGAALKVRVTSAPERGRANAALLKLLAREWGRAASRLAVVAGAGARRKTVLAAGDAEALLRSLRAWAKRHHGQRG